MRDSPEAPSPTSQYSTRQSGSPGPAVGLNEISPMGWLRVFSRTRISSRAVPSNVVFAVIRVGPLDEDSLVNRGAGRVDDGASSYTR